MEEGLYVLAVTSFSATNSVFNKTDKNNSFSISTSGYWSARGGLEIIQKLQKILELRSQKDIELQVEEVRKRGTQIKIADKEYKLPDVDAHKNEIF